MKDRPYQLISDTGEFFRFYTVAAARAYAAKHLKVDPSRLIQSRFGPQSVTLSACGESGKSLHLSGEGV